MSDDRKLAMFIDFENIVRGVKEAQYKQFEIKLVLERLVEKGKIMVKRAYADWNRYTEYKRPFHEHAIELIDVPQSHYSGKNSADIRMVVDAMDLAYAKQHVDTFALVSGWLLSFTLSLDDLVISQFVTGPADTTLPILVYSSVRRGVSPEINVLATIIVGIVTIGIVLATLLLQRRERIRRRELQA